MEAIRSNLGNLSDLVEEAELEAMVVAATRRPGRLEDTTLRAEALGKHPQRRSGALGKHSGSTRKHSGSTRKHSEALGSTLTCASCLATKGASHCCAAALAFGLTHLTYWHSEVASRCGQWEEHGSSQKQSRAISLTWHSEAASVSRSARSWRTNWPPSVCEALRRV